MNKLEEISAFMDGEAELSAESITASVHNDAELFGAWRRYHLVSDSLRGQLPAQFPATDLSARISRALESEPAILSPQRRTATVSQRILKPAAGLAIAASVALVAIIGLRGMDQTAGTGSMTGDTTVAATDAVATAPAPEQIEVQAPRQSLQPAAQSQLARTVSTEAEAVPGDYQQSGQATGQYRFNSYLINHNEYRANSGVHGMPYARIVAPYGSNQ